MVTYAMYQVQHWGDVGGPFAHRTTGKHVVAAHADDQNIMMVIDVADYAVTHPSRGRADLPTVRHATVQPARRATREASMIDEQIFIRDADGVEPPLPKQLRDAVQQTAILLSEGKSVTISATEQELTTEQAARTLGVSRQTLVRMLDKGLIPFSPPITSSQNPPDRLVGIRTGLPQPP